VEVAAAATTAVHGDGDPEADLADAPTTTDAGTSIIVRTRA